LARTYRGKCLWWKFSLIFDWKVQWHFRTFRPELIHKISPWSPLYLSVYQFLIVI
jgi:hypothetical protein